MTPKEMRAYLESRDTFARHLGVELETMEQGRCVATLPLDERHRNAMGNAHGGAIFALTDMAFTGAAVSLGIPVVNAQSSISYTAPGKTGPLRAEAHPVHVGRKLNTFEVTVTDAAGTLVARALVTGYAVSLLPADAS
jgi:acyl-CoA thioesterase